MKEGEGKFGYANFEDDTIHLMRCCSASVGTEVKVDPKHRIER